MGEFTPQERRVLNALADGKPHSIDELMQCLWDEMSGRGALISLVSKLRRKLEPHNQYIHCLEATDERPVSYIHLIRSSEYLAR